VPLSNGSTGLLLIFGRLPEAGNARFVELTLRLDPHVTDPGLTHIIDTSATEIHRPTSLSAQSATVLSGWSPCLLVVLFGTSRAHILAVSWIPKSAHAASTSIWRLSKLRVYRRQSRHGQSEQRLLVQKRQSRLRENHLHRSHIGKMKVIEKLFKRLCRI
jgi:hypothetical protein